MQKLGDGPVNYDWNLRFFVLNYQTQELTYFGSEEDQTPRGIIALGDALISNITLIKEREHSFSLQCFPQPQGKIYFFSCNSMEESQDWQSSLIRASVTHKQSFVTVEPDQFQNQEQQQRSEPSYFELFDEQALLEESENESDGFIGLDQIKARMSQGIAAHFGGTNKGSKSFTKKRPVSRMGAISDKKSEVHEIHDKSIVVQALDSLEVVPENQQGYSISQQNQETIDNLKLIDEMLTDQSEWKTIKIDNGIEYQASNSRSGNIKIDKKSLKSFIILMAVVGLAVYMISSCIQPFFCGAAIAYTLISKASKFLSYQPKFSNIRGRVLIKGSYDEVSQTIYQSYQQHNDKIQHKLVIMPLSHTHCMVYIFTKLQNVESLSLLQRLQSDQNIVNRISIILNSIKESVTISRTIKTNLDNSFITNEKSVGCSESGDDEDTDEHSQFQ